MSGEPSSSQQSARLHSLAERLVREVLAAEEASDVFLGVPDDVLHRFVVGNATTEERVKVERLISDNPEFARAISVFSSVDDIEADESPGRINLPIILSPSASATATNMDWQSEWNACRQELMKHAASPRRGRWRLAAIWAAMKHGAWPRADHWRVAAPWAAAAIAILFIVGLVQIRSRVDKLERDHAQRQATDDPEMLRMRLEQRAEREFTGVMAANHGNSSEVGVRLVATARKIRQWEIEQNIPQLVALDTPVVRFDQVVQRYASGLSRVGHVGAVNLETYPEGSDNPEQVTEYFYAQWALDILRSKAQALAISDLEKEAIVALVHSDQEARGGALWGRLSTGRAYIAIRTDFKKEGSGTVTFDLVDADVRLVKSEEFEFRHSYEPVSLRRRFTRWDYEAGGEVDVRKGDSADEMVVSFSGAEAASHRISLLTHDDGASTAAMGNLAYLCFETRVEDESAHATVGFTTGGFGGDLVAAGLPPRSYTNSWQLVRIPVDLGDASLWHTGLTINVIGDLPSGKSVKVYVRNGYIQPIGGPAHVIGVSNPI